jgi:hypothetical protein
MSMKWLVSLLALLLPMVAAARTLLIPPKVIGNHVRGFVNGDLKFELDDASLAPSGRSGVLMYKAASDLWAWTTYQP